MRTHHTVAALAATGLLALTGCTPSEIKTKPDAAAPAPAASSTPATSAPAQQKAAIGSTLTLKGNTKGEQLAVTIKKWADPATPADDFMKPDEGKRWVAAQVEVTNTGTAVYDDTPGNGMQVADADGQRFQSSFTETTAGPQMPGTVKLPAGDKALGWVTFEVPKDSKVVTIQFAMNSGFATQTGQWTVS
ncbi:DUF4352 domain-containing protein [Streptomyces sp. A1136]|uniref:DUF4352 domain-containing protein n=1 Tax=Streptomyces sp. A1136 TaxID=2563102 RepID=UPI00109E3B2E|nr:DUF4352 domain-containing protein [Streptomyces sp. A1136]THA44489.1 DUF4352 domain-containing protein [Streptomyces sp. A1136]